MGFFAQPLQKVYLRADLLQGRDSRADLSKSIHIQIVFIVHTPK